MSEARKLTKQMDGKTIREQEKLGREINELIEQVFVFYDKEGRQINYLNYMRLMLHPNYKIIALNEGGGEGDVILTTWGGVVQKRKKDTARFYHSEIEQGRSRICLCHSRSHSDALSFHSNLLKRSLDRGIDGEMNFDGLDYRIQEMYRDNVPMMADIDKQFKSSGAEQIEIKYDDYLKK